MEEEIRENPRLLVIVLSTAAVAVAIFAIFLLTLVWSPIQDTDKVEDTEEIIKKVGTFNRLYINEKDVVENYCRNVLNIFASGDINLINEIILPEYLEFRNIDKSKLKTALNQKGVLGKMLNFSSYKSITHPKFGRIHEVNISTYDNSYSDKMLIIQKSPNEYKVSFDGFIGLSRDVNSVTVDGLRLDIKEVKELATVTYIKLSLTNVSGHNITINKDNNYENIYLKLMTNSEIRMNTNWLSGETVELTSGYVVNLDSEFVTAGFNSGVGKSIILKNVYDNLSKESKDIEFSIY